MPAAARDRVARTQLVSFPLVGPVNRAVVAAPRAGPCCRLLAPFTSGHRGARKETPAPGGRRGWGSGSGGRAKGEWRGRGAPHGCIGEEGEGGIRGRSGPRAKPAPALPC